MLATSLSGQPWCGQVSRQHSGGKCCLRMASWQPAAIVSPHAVAPTSVWHSLRVEAAAGARRLQNQLPGCNNKHIAVCRAASTDESAQAAAQRAQDAGVYHSSADLQLRQSSISSSSRGSSLSSMDDGMSVHLADAGAALLAVTAAASDSSQLDSKQLPMPAAVIELAKANEETETVNRLDVYKAIAVGGAVSVLAGILAHEWVDAHQGVAMSLLFGLGYAGILVEELVGLNKAGVALLMAVCLWTIRSTAGLPVQQVDAEVAAALASVSELIFFILGAMTIVEVVDVHGGFKRLASWVVAEQRSTLAWGVGLLSFAMSAVLDNLTTTILMLSILARANPTDAELRKLLGAVVVIAANAGGAWTPIGDVTTTMLWVGGQITPLPTMRDLFVPSLVSMAVPVALLCATAQELQGPVARPAPGTAAAAAAASIHKPSAYMGMLSGLGVLWMVTDALHFGESRAFPRVQDALRNLDIAGVMFFMGILMSVEALNAAGLLGRLALTLNDAVPNVDTIAASIGLVSALIDNVPLVAATQGMYDTGSVPADSPLWQLIALCAGTGGSLLVIGSAAGVAYMGLEGAGFGWYMRK
ncbi:citrate transporter-domain-containing protein [Scenedesmus sp. NREL 46B-D3]|nr:citrate transporter-domain-containing protein [Scenedesmus sp. NREL 46B-D3]